MVTAVAKQPKKESATDKKTDDRAGRKTAPVQVMKDLARMAAVVASHRGISQGELLDPVIRPFLLAQYAAVRAAMDQELADQK